MLRRTIITYLDKYFFTHSVAYVPEVLLMCQRTAGSTNK
jgi:hypothetical protein